MSHLLLDHGKITDWFEVSHQFLLGLSLSSFVIGKWQYVCSSSFQIFPSSVATLILSFLMSKPVAIL